MNKRNIEISPSMIHILPTSIKFWATYIMQHNKYHENNKGYFKATEKGTVIEVGIKSEDGWWRILSKQYVPHIKSI